MSSADAMLRLLVDGRYREARLLATRNLQTSVENRHFLAAPMVILTGLALGDFSNRLLTIQFSRPIELPHNPSTYDRALEGLTLLHRCRWTEGAEQLLAAFREASGPPKLLIAGEAIHACVLTGQYSNADTVLSEALTLNQQLQVDPLRLVEAQVDLAIAKGELSDAIETLAVYEESALLDNQHERSIQAMWTRLMILTGKLVDADCHFCRARDARDSGDGTLPFLVSDARRMMDEVYLLNCSGDRQGAQDLAETLVARLDEQFDPTTLADARILDVLVSARDGNPALQKTTNALGLLSQRNGDDVYLGYIDSIRGTLLALKARSEPSSYNAFLTAANAINEVRAGNQRQAAQRVFQIVRPLFAASPFKEAAEVANVVVPSSGGPALTSYVLGDDRLWNRWLS